MNILCVGEMLADLIVRPVENVLFQDETYQVDDICIANGGDSNNNAANFVKLGHHVIYMGRLGCDIMGDYVLKTAQEAGIDMSHVTRSDTTPQAKSLILINPAGERTFVQCPGSSAEFCFEDCDLSVLDSVALLQVAGTFHMAAFDGAGCARLLKAAQEHNVITSMDVTSDRTNRWRGILDPCYPYLDYFLPSIEQAMMIAETEKPEEIADFFLSRGVKNIAIKLGSKGSYFKNAETAFYAGTYQNLKIVETTGAGDAFCAGFLTGVLQKLSPRGCVTMGTACSAFAIQAAGATTGTRDLETVRRFIAERPALEFSE